MNRKKFDYEGTLKLPGGSTIVVKMKGTSRSDAERRIRRFFRQLELKVKEVA